MPGPTARRALKLISYVAGAGVTFKLVFDTEYDMPDGKDHVFSDVQRWCVTRNTVVTSSPAHPPPRSHPRRYKGRVDGLLGVDNPLVAVPRRAPDPGAAPAAPDPIDSLLHKGLAFIGIDYEDTRQRPVPGESRRAGQDGTGPPAAAAPAAAAAAAGDSARR